MALILWRLLLVVAWLFLVLGVTLPIMRIERLYFFTDAPSLLGLVAYLWNDDDAGLAIVVCLFSILLPVAKLVMLTLASLDLSGKRPVAAGLGRILPHLSKWSMMDVMLVAIVIFAAKTSGLAQAFTQPGLWFYGGSALLAGLLPALRPQTAGAAKGG